MGPSPSLSASRGSSEKAGPSSPRSFQRRERALAWDLLCSFQSHLSPFAEDFLPAFLKNNFQLFIKV